MSQDCYVVSVQNGEVRLCCGSPDHRAVLRRMGATRSWPAGRTWTLSYGSEDELARIFRELRDLGFAFTGGPAGWPPSAVFEDLRDKGLVNGTCIEIVWTGPETTRLRRR